MFHVHLFFNQVRVIDKKYSFFITLPIKILNERVALPAVSRTVIASAKLKLLSISTLDR